MIIYNWIKLNTFPSRNIKPYDMILVKTSLRSYFSRIKAVTSLSHTKAEILTINIKMCITFF